MKIKLFAVLKDVAGDELEECFDGDSVTVAELQRRLQQSHPEFEPYLSGLAIAVNKEYVNDDQQLLHDCDEVALIPPISGGDVPHFLVTPCELDPRSLRDLVRTDRSGAIVVFEGVVREHHDDHKVLRLEYQSYERMAEQQLETVARTVLQELPAHDIAVHHRVGMLEIGETSLLVAVSAEHRAEAFAATLLVVDRVKSSVPVWKREFTPDGSVWQDGVPAHPDP